MPPCPSVSAPAVNKAVVQLMSPVSENSFCLFVPHAWYLIYGLGRYIRNHVSFGSIIYLYFPGIEVKRDRYVSSRAAD